MQHLFR